MKSDSHSKTSQYVSQEQQEAVRLLRAVGASPKKILGQHFLIDMTVIDRMLERAGDLSDKHVVEIGPGLGVLSKRLLEAQAHVTAFEFDDDMRKVLARELPQLSVIPGDAIKTIPAFVSTVDAYSVIANIPYSITTPLLRLLYERDEVLTPQFSLLLIQDEVAKRLTVEAPHRERGFLTVLFEYLAPVSYLFQVPPGAFYPEPQVNSAVIYIQNSGPRWFKHQKEREQAFLGLVRSSFLNPRKQLKNVLAGIKGVPHDEITVLFERLGWKSQVRAHELTLEQWRALFELTEETWK